MKLSEKKKSELFSAIYDPLLEERIALKKVEDVNHNYVDDMLFLLPDKIWRRVNEALNLDGPA
jgi:hypothetical protein